MQLPKLKKKSFFSPDELAVLEEAKIPKHVAIIMDGNRRWGKSHHATKKTLMGKTVGGLIDRLIGDGNHENATLGHWEGARALTDIIQAAIEIGISTLTVYGFSTENWSRTKREIDLVFRIMELYISGYTEELSELGVRFHAIGNLTTLSNSLQRAIQKTMQKTAEKSAGRKTLDFVVAINYGARDEMRRAFISLHKACNENRVSESEISEELISRYLDTAPFSDPDLLIRTSGEMRLSNFLLWQLAYAEIYVTDVLWPDFKPSDLLSATLTFQKRERRTGK